jgi:hypothetical protein
MHLRLVGGMPRLLGGCCMRVLRRKQLDVNNFFMKECSLRAGVILPLRFLLIGRGTQGDVLENLWVSPEIRRLLVEWGAAASSIKPRSLSVLKLHVKENCVFCLRGESLIFESKTP